MTARSALLTVDALISAGLAPADQAADLDRVAKAFRIRLSPAMQAAIGDARDADDPVARQFVPRPEELTIRPEELSDPIGDHSFSPVPGLTHRYPDRVILHATQTCEVYCRFCFRREAVGEDGTLPDAQMEAALAYVAATPAIREVILTGGDPLVLSARRLGQIMARLAAIDHVDCVRLHSRVPVVAPQRITPALLAALGQHPSTWVVVHTNHVNELTAPACAALARLVGAGIPLLSQSVLLKGVNDTPDALEALFRALLRNRVKPYYLHHCDLARGTSHFRTTLAEGQALMAALRGRLSGTCLPTYVLDIPGGHGKVPVGPAYVAETGASGRYRVTDWQGRTHDYADPGA